MRNSFIEELSKIALTDNKVFLIVGDLGFGVVEGFEEKFPDQFLNAGVAEQNMMGMAAGLASAGYKVFVYSIGNFPTFRCLEQIRNDVCYHSFNVTIVSIGAGLSYGPLGYSHHAIDDIGVMRTLPGMTIYAPADPIETKIALRASLSCSTPKYFRLGKSGESNIFDKSQSNFPEWSEVWKGDDLLILTSGSIIIEAIEAAQTLKTFGINISVVSIPILKPFTLDKELIKRFKNIIVLEEHSIVGGLGSIILEQVALNGMNPTITVLGLPDNVSHELGSQKYLRSFYKIDSANIVVLIKRLLQK
jgi:transketolase